MQLAAQALQPAHGSGARAKLAGLTEAPVCRMFGGMFGGFGGQGEEEEQIPKGADVYVELEASLEELYLGATIEVCAPHQALDAACMPEQTCPG